MPTDPTHDVLIVGARVAGAATAMLLARQGLRVLVVDQGRLGSDILSTHALMRGGVIQLSRWGLLDAVRAAGTPPVRRTVVRYGAVDEVVDIKPIPHCDALYAPRRTVLDPLLVAAARRAGAEFRFGVRATGLLRDDLGRVAGAVVRTRDGRRQELRARITVGADGIRSVVAREVRARCTVRGTASTALVGGYVTGLTADGYQWLYGQGASAGIIPTNDGKLCAWAAVPSREFARIKDLPDLGFHATMRRVAPDWADVLADARFDGPVRGFPGVVGFMRRPWGPGWALVGDASHFKDPLSAHGMTDALRDAELLAEAIVAGVTGGAQEQEAFGDYERSRDELSLELFALTDRVATHDWDLAELRELLVALSGAMRTEVGHLLDRDRQLIPA